jgi:hypothetical protein
MSTECSLRSSDQFLLLISFLFCLFLPVIIAGLSFPLSFFLSYTFSKVLMKTVEMSE